MRVTFDIRDERVKPLIMMLLQSEGFVFRMPNRYYQVGIPPDVMAQMVTHVLGRITKPAIELMITAYKHQVEFNEPKVADRVAGIVDDMMVSLMDVLKEVNPTAVERALGRHIEIPGSQKWFMVGIEKTLIEQIGDDRG